MHPQHHGSLTAAGLATALLFAASAATTAAPLTPATDAAVVIRGDLGARLDAVARSAAEDGFHGVVLVAKNGEEVLAKGYGLADRARGLAFAPDTPVQIGSNVKDLTKIAIFQLVEAGRLQLASPLSTWFPDAPADKRGITVDQLLEHRAGLPLGFGRDEEEVSLDTFLARLFAAPLEAPPGTGERYSNAGYSLLAAIVERVSGQSFDHYVQRAILQPAGMPATGLLLPGFDPARLAHGYTAGEDRGTMLDLPRLADGHGWNLRGNGGYVSTVRDMMRLYRALAGPTLLREATHRDRILEPGAPVVLAGSDLVCFFLFGRFPQEGVELVIATNHAEYRSPRLLRLFEPVLALPAPPAEPPPVDPLAPPAVLPDSGPGRTVAAYVAAWNSGDIEQLRAFFTEWFLPRPDAPPIETRLANHRRMIADLGQLTLERVMETPEGLELVVRGSTGERATLRFVVETQAPFRLRSLMVQIG